MKCPLQYMQQENTMKASESTAVYIARKAVQLILSLIVLSLIVFFVSRLAPGDPLRAYYGEAVERMSEQQLEAAQHRLGLDRSLPVQYFTWAGDALRGDFGISYQYKQPVTEVIGSVIGNTMILTLLSFILIAVLGLLLAIFCVQCSRQTGMQSRCGCKQHPGIFHGTDTCTDIRSKTGCAAAERSDIHRRRRPCRQNAASHPAGSCHIHITYMVLRVSHEEQAFRRDEQRIRTDVQSQGADRTSDNIQTLCQEHHAIGSQYNGGIPAAFAGWSICDRDGLFISGSGQTGA